MDRITQRLEDEERKRSYPIFPEDAPNGVCLVNDILKLPQHFEKIHERGMDAKTRELEKAAEAEALTAHNKLTAAIKVVHAANPRKAQQYEIFPCAYPDPGVIQDAEPIDLFSADKLAIGRFTDKELVAKHYRWGCELPDFPGDENCWVLGTGLIAKDLADLPFDPPLKVCDDAYFAGLFDAGIMERYLQKQDRETCRGLVQAVHELKYDDDKMRSLLPQYFKHRSKITGWLLGKHGAAGAMLGVEKYEKLEMATTTRAQRDQTAQTRVIAEATKHFPNLAFSPVTVALHFGIDADPGVCAVLVTSRSESETSLRFAVSGLEPRTPYTPPAEFRVYLPTWCHHDLYGLAGLFCLDPDRDAPPSFVEGAALRARLFDIKKDEEQLERILKKGEVKIAWKCGFTLDASAFGPLHSPVRGAMLSFSKRGPETDGWALLKELLVERFGAQAGSTSDQKRPRDESAAGSCDTGVKKMKVAGALEADTAQRHGG